MEPFSLETNVENTGISTEAQKLSILDGSVTSTFETMEDGITQNNNQLIISSHEKTADNVCCRQIFHKSTHVFTFNIFSYRILENFQGNSRPFVSSISGGEAAGQGAHPELACQLGAKCGHFWTFGLGTIHSIRPF